MNGFAPKVRYPLVLIGSSLPAAHAHAAGTLDLGDGCSVTIGAGLRAGFSAVEDAAPSGTDDSGSFSLQSARLYVSSAASETQFTFDTERLDRVFGGTAPSTDGRHFGVQVQI